MKRKTAEIQTVDKHINYLMVVFHATLGSGLVHDMKRIMPRDWPKRKRDGVRGKIARQAGLGGERPMTTNNFIRCDRISMVMTHSLDEALATPDNS